MTTALHSIVDWIIKDYWPGLVVLLLLILLCGATMVRTATVWAIRRK